MTFKYKTRRCFKHIVGLIIIENMFSKRDFKRKKREEQEAAAHVFQDFIETFQNPQSSVANKTFVRSGLLYPDNQEQVNENVSKIYNPKPLICTKQNEPNSAVECAKILKDNIPDKTKKRLKPKSNLDLLKEELKLRHDEKTREEKGKLKEEINFPPTSTSDADKQGTTNLFVANLHPSVTENHLMLEFGAYGPLASVKILWPRGEEAGRNTNCGFVAFMSRKDAERALNDNQHREDMRVCWGRSVELPSFPVYIPNSLLKLYLPPPASGLPFNAQPPSPNGYRNIHDCYVKVTIPFNKKILMLIHRMIEFVVTEGPMFEAFIMNREINNPDYKFLFDYQSPNHVYYRWKLFSILNGDSQKNWSMKKFRMFEGGSIWCPPIAPSYTDGMPEELFISKSKPRNKLSDAQCDKLTNLVRNLTTQRRKIAEAMMFCLNHAEAIDDSIDIIADSLLNPDTGVIKKVARLYLLSDILSNCKTKRIDLQYQQETLLDIFRMLRTNADSLNVCDRDSLILRILRVIRHWDIYKMFPVALLETLNNMFSTDGVNDEDDTCSIDGPLDGANLLKRSECLGTDDVKKIDSNIDIAKYFVPSKWDAVDPDEVESQAMSTEKMYLMEIDKLADVGGAKKRKKKKHKSKNH
ncbi:U2 snRNP-associated SURP motif-containing protein-like [Diorhabda sublineata]|uniref:U2 snRNP-associated SURP motif-containing protein-like n=1 Tax=Diorhabda sublineata TaxID=1163346 RepID=UPI0024E058C9|nr:U2 snRNP-associated SURP motif-containing protein-like [Diorhabda sublineata]